jgi:hypothetical protein
MVIRMMVTYQRPVVPGERVLECHSHLDCSNTLSDNHSHSDDELPSGRVQPQPVCVGDFFRRIGNHLH